MEYPRLRVAVDARELEDGRTGIARFLINLLEESLDREEFHWILLGRRALHLPPAFFERMEMVPLRRRRTAVLEDLLSFRTLEERYQWDVFLSPYYKLPLRLRMPSLAVMHDLTPLTRGSAAYRFYFGLRASHAARNAAAVVTVSSAARDEVTRRFPFLKERIKMIPNAVDDRFSPGEEEALPFLKEKKLSLGRYILYVGNDLPHKNIPNLLCGYAQLKKELRDQYPLVLTISPESVQPLLRSLGIEKDVRFLGSVGDDQLLALYQGTRLFVFPSLAEGFGLPPLEAMACGVPVAVSEIPVLKEVAGKAAFYFDPCDAGSVSAALTRGLLDEEERGVRIQQGLRQAEQYRRKAVLAPWWPLLRDLGEKGRRLRKR